MIGDANKQRDASGGKPPAIKTMGAVLALFVILLALIVITGCSNEDIDGVKAQSYSVGGSVLPADSGETFGETINRYCPGGKWEQFTSSDYQSVVEYSGGKSPQGKVRIQWIKLIGVDWSVWVVELDGEQLTDSQINSFFEEARSN
jgi:hypothetical protein